MLGHLCVEIQVSQELTWHTDWVYCVVQLADGRALSASDDKSLRVWDLTTGSCTQELTWHTKAVYYVVQLADGRIASCSDDNSLRVWDIAYIHLILKHVSAKPI